MTQASTIAGGRANPALAIVSADQDTIIGNGTTEDPLRLGTGGQTTAVAVFGSGAVPKCTPMRPVALAERVVSSALASSNRSVATVMGLLVTGVAALQVDRADTIQYEGVFEATTAEWDAVTGGSGGLIPGEPYYVSDTTGRITGTAPNTSGHFITQIGISLSTTELLLQISAPQAIP